jgi:hypothetical protein
MIDVSNERAKFALRKNNEKRGERWEISPQGVGFESH